MEERIDSALKFIKDTIIEIFKNVIVDFVVRHRIISVFIILILILIVVGLSMLKKDLKNKNKVKDALIKKYNTSEHREQLQCIEETIKNMEESPKKSVQRSAQKDLKKNIEKTPGSSGIYFFKPSAYYFGNSITKVKRESFEINDRGYFRVPFYIINISNNPQKIKSHLKVQKKGTDFCIEKRERDPYILGSGMVKVSELKVDIPYFNQEGIGKGDYEIILNINNKDIYKNNIKIV